MCNNLNIKDKYFRLTQLKSMAIGDNLSLRPLDAGILFNEHNELSIIPTLAKMSPDIRKYLPGMDIYTEDSAKKYFEKYIIGTELGLKLGYTIRYGTGVCGFVFVITPDYNKITCGINQWMIDFAMFKIFEGKGLMKTALFQILYFLKYELKINGVFATIDDENKKCINLLSKFNFQKTTERSVFKDRTASLYECDLSTINFK